MSEPGGEAIANTAWTILTSAGDTVDEENGAFPTLVLLEGSYSAVARYKDKIYERDFTVKAGVNTDVEVLMKDPQPQEPMGSGATAATVPPGQKGLPQPDGQKQPEAPLPSYEQLVPQGEDGSSLD